jgi:hypothetical protein
MRMARGRRAIVVIGVVGLLAGIVGVVRPAIGVDAGGRSPGSGQESGTAPTVAERTAAAQARASGQRVEVVAKRSETMEVFAEPNGTFTAVLHPGPVRVLWVEFGYQDTTPESVARFRKAWLDAGPKWRRPKAMPPGWSLSEQLAGIPAQWRRD